MKKIGLVGGIGPASTVEYYLGLVERCRREQGRNCYPEIVIDSVNMWKHDKAFQENDGTLLGDYVCASLSALKAAGAEIAAITANAEHIIWDRICDSFPLPVISIVDAVIKEVERRNLKSVLIFGTAVTMRSRLYEHALMKHGIRAITPSEQDIDVIGGLIYPNLENGILIPEDQRKLLALAQKYIEEERAEALLLGCTELHLAMKQEQVCVPVLDSAGIHMDEIYENASKINIL